MDKHTLVPLPARVLEYVDEGEGLFTLRLALNDDRAHNAYSFEPGQFNMLYLPAVGEIPISIVSDPHERGSIDHTIRAVGRVSRGLAALRAGARIGLRGPYGRGWPLLEARGRDVIVVSGGLGCAPTVSVINFIMRRREEFGELNIVQGVKHSRDLIWAKQYADWSARPRTHVMLAADASDPPWPWHVGRVTDLFDKLVHDTRKTLVMMCGPEGMMYAVSRELMARGVAQRDIWLSMERNMQCAVGLCGHCQFGDKFVCRQGPVFNYSEIADYFGKRGI